MVPSSEIFPEAQMARSAKATNQTEVEAPANPYDVPFRYGTRLQLAELHTRLFAPLAPKSLEKWPLAWRTVNGRAVADVKEFLVEAERRFNAAPVIRGGRMKQAA